MSNDNYEAARLKARYAIDSPTAIHNGGRGADNGYYTWIAGKAVAESILALAAAIRPDPFEVNVKVDAEEARAAAEAVVAAHSAQNGRGTR